MNCHSAREIFSELLDARTPATAQPEARAHLAHCPECQREFSALNQTLAALDTMPTPAPTPRLRQNFYAMLAEEKQAVASERAEASTAAAGQRERATRSAAHPARASLWRWILAPVAAGAIALAAFQAGARYGAAPMPAVATTTAAAPGPVASADETMTRKLDQLEKRLDEMRNLMAISMIQQQQNSPTSERFREVLAAAQDENPNEKVLNDLVSALAFDPSANLRLRALEGLFPHIGNPAVRTGILAALQREQNPLVQIEMIEAVAVTHDREAEPVLSALAKNETADLSVRDAARRALAQL